jgi:AcrR family transcriptional regulator
MAFAASLSVHVRQKRVRRRAEILDGAMRSFREKGYHETTLNDIAQRVGVRKTALYHYFPDKASLLYECHLLSLRELERVLAEACRKSGRAPDRLAFLIREHVRVMTDTVEGSPSAFDVAALSPAHQRDIIAGRDRYERGMRSLIRDGIDRGEFRAVDEKTAVFAILGAVNWIARWYQPGGALDGPALGSAFADYLVGGLSCQP